MKKFIIFFVINILIVSSVFGLELNFTTRQFIKKTIENGQKRNKIVQTKDQNNQNQQNHPPQLIWVGEVGYTSDGLEPEIGFTTTTFVYKIKYIDEDNDPPASGYPKIHIKKGNSEIIGSPFTMNYVSGSYNIGAIYIYSTTLVVGTNYTYYFETKDKNENQVVTTPEINAPDVEQYQPTSNSPPSISSLTANPSILSTGTVSVISCLAIDPDNDTLTYTWGNTGGIISGSGSSINWTAPSTSGTYTITCTVSDSKGGFDQKSVEITVYVNYNVHILWKKSFYKESPYIDSYGIAIDAYDNIYTSGYTTTTITNRDFLVSKFDKSGNTLWKINYTSSPIFDIGMCITCDNKGNFYITGLTLNNKTFSWDVLTLKCNSYGTVLWKQSYDGGNSDGGFGIAVNEIDGSVYVSGTSSKGVTGDDIILLKYTSSGELVWTKTYHNSIKDHGYSVAVDKDGNIFVCGYILNTNNMTYDYLVLKYNSSSELQPEWVKTYDSGYNDNAIGIAIDTLGNIYTTGQTHNGSNYDFLTIKYDNNGNLLWIKTLDTGKDDLGYAIALDKDNNVYLTGQTGQQTDQSTFDFLTVKYNPDGNLLWTEIYDGGMLDGGYAIAVDKEGSVYVLGQTQITTTEYNYLLIKYSQY